MNLKQIAPGEIEKRSFEIIEEELGRELDPVLKPIIKRVIHTTADFSYADTLFFQKMRWKRDCRPSERAYPSLRIQIWEEQA